MENTTDTIMEQAAETKAEATETANEAVMDAAEAAPKLEEAEAAMDATIEATAEAAETKAEAAQETVATQTATAAPEQIVPELTLDGIGATQIMTTASANLKPFDKENFTEAEQKQIDAFAKKIDLTNTNVVLQYGATAQNNATTFAEAALKGMKTKELGEMQNMLTDMTVQVKGFGEEEKKGLFGLFKKGQNKVEAMKARYSTIEANLDKVEDKLQNHQFELLKDIATLDKLYDQNRLYFKELSMYIAAGKMKLEEVRNGQLVELQKKAEETKLPEDVQAATDLAQMCNRFEKKLYDLELTRTVTLQTAPQIRTVQDANIRTTESLQSTITNVIPLWKREMVMTMSNAHSLEAAKAQQMVADATNEMLEQNAEMLKEAAIKSAEEYERGIIDIETIQHNNDTLIEAIQEVMRIQTEGQQRRREAEVELTRLEEDLKAKLLAASQPIDQQM